MNDPNEPAKPDGVPSQETLRLERLLRSVIEQLDAEGFSVAAAHASQALDALLVHDDRLRPTTLDDSGSPD